MTMKPTPPMKKSIKIIEMTTGNKFKGSTFEEASEFISKYKDESMKVDLRTVMKPSKKMMDKIEKIEEVFGYKYTGTTMAHASEFLDTYLPELIEYYNKLRENSTKAQPTKKRSDRNDYPKVNKRNTEGY